MRIIHQVDAQVAKSTVSIGSLPSIGPSKTPRECPIAGLGRNSSLLIAKQVECEIRCPFRYSIPAVHKDFLSSLDQ